MASRWSLRWMFVVTALCAVGFALATNFLLNRKPEERLLQWGAARHVVTLNKGPSIAVFEMRGTDVSAYVMELAYRCPGAIDDLSLRRCTLTSNALASLSRLPRLRAIDLADSNAADEHLAVIAKLPALRAINLTGTNVTDAGVAALAGHPTLTHISLADNPRLTDVSARAIAAIPNLRSVDFSGCSISDAGASAALASRPLERFGAARTRITDAAFETLSPESPLCDVTIYGTNVGDATLQLLARLPAVREVVVHRTNVSPEGISALVKAPTLKWLYCDPSDFDAENQEPVRPELNVVAVSGLSLSERVLLERWTIDGFPHVMPHEVKIATRRHLSSSESIATFWNGQPVLEARENYFDLLGLVPRARLGPIAPSQIYRPLWNPRTASSPAAPGLGRAPRQPASSPGEQRGACGALWTDFPPIPITNRLRAEERY